MTASSDAPDAQASSGTAANNSDSTAPGIFASTGTVKLEYRGGGQVSKIHFTPSKHHTIEHLGKKYAVFVPDSLPRCRSRPLDSKAVELKEVGVEIDAFGVWSPMHRDLALAAIKSIAVDILVTVEKKELHLCRAVIPARSHTK